MTGIDHRSPGVAVAALLDDAVFTELIADGVHVDRALWPLITRLKGDDRLLLVSDAISLAGTGDGRGRIGTLEVVVAGDRVHARGHLDTGRLGTVARRRRPQPRRHWHAAARGRRRGVT